jgi:hypothetical protein
MQERHLQWYGESTLPFVKVHTHGIDDTLSIASSTDAKFHTNMSRQLHQSPTPRGPDMEGIIAAAVEAALPYWNGDVEDPNSIMTDSSNHIPTREHQ